MMTGRGSSLVCWLAAVVVAFIALCTGASAATWKLQRLPFDPAYAGGEIGPLFAISCPSSDFCLTGGSHGKLATTARPESGAWNVFYVPPGDDNGGPPPPPGAENLPPYRPHVLGVSCPSSSLCVAVSNAGDIYTSSDPSRGTAAWSRADIDADEFNTHLEAVSCPSPSFCVAVSGGTKSNNNPSTSGKILSSHDPTGGSAAWHIAQLDPPLDLRSVSCGSPTLCVAVGQNGRIVTSTDPDGGPSAWHDAGSPAGSSHLGGIACVTGPLCVAGTASGNLLTSTDPAGQPTQWASRSGGGSVPITGVSCPTETRCLAVDNNGDVIVSDRPTGDSDAWAFENVLPYTPKPEGQPVLNGMFGVSCPSISFCAIAAADGQVLTSTDPFARNPTAPDGVKRARQIKRPRTILARVDRKRVRTSKRRLRVRFRFYARTQTRGFLCKRDRRPYRRCKSPVGYWVGLGNHVFRVRAIGPTGLRGPVALDRFKIVGPNAKCPCA